MWLRKFKSKSWFSAKKGPESRAADIGFNWKLIKLCQTYCLEVCWMFVLAGQIFLRRLNQTGDKWLSVPDIGDWLVMDGNRMVNSGLTFFGEFTYFLNCNFKNYTRNNSYHFSKIKTLLFKKHFQYF